MNGSFPMFYIRLIIVSGLILFSAGCSKKDPITDATGNAPVVESFSIAYLKRPATTFFTDAQVATSFPVPLNAANTVGITPGDVYLRDLSSTDNPSINLTSAITAPIPDVKSAGDVSGLSVSYDGRYLVFSMHEGMYVGLMDDEQPKWNIWVYDTQADAGVDPLQRVITSDTEAFKGNDIDPHFLPDNRIVFSSDRRDGSRPMNLDLYGDEYITVNEHNARNSGATAYAIHVMNFNGTNIQQLTFNQSNDLKPTVLDSGPDNGKILFTRWDGVGGRTQLNLYTVNPDGTGLNVFYGAHSHNFYSSANPLQYALATPLPDGNLLSMHIPFTGTRGGGDMIIIDKDNFVEANHQRFTSPTLSVDGQWWVSKYASSDLFNPFAGKSLYGRYMTPFPIYEPGSLDRVLVSLDVCRVTVDPTQPIAEACDSNNISDTAYQLADPLYSIFLYSLYSKTQPLVVPPELGYALVNPVALLNRPLAQRPITIDPNPSVDPDLVARRVGIINIKTVYDTEGTTSMVDRPLQPSGSNPLLGTEVIPTTTVQMDKTTGNLITGTPDPSAVPVNRTVADIATIRDPALTTAAQRVARYVRIDKAVPRFDNTNLTGNDFGNTGNYSSMREILGYTEVEPDGSVYMEVPADVPFTINVLDGKGRSLMSHTNWLQIQPGEVVVCNGCHSPRDGQGSINPGASADGPFPNTVNTMSALQGETMAETRARLDCFVGCNYQKLKRDLVYDDIWTDAGQAGRAPDAHEEYSYDTLTTTSPVTGTDLTSTGCGGNWEWSSHFCRIAINYPEHIQPIWEANRVDNLGATVTCVGCHNDTTAGNNLILNTDVTNPDILKYIADNNLTITDPADPMVTPRVPSYEFLFSTRPELVMLNGNLVINAVRDVDGNPIDVNGLIVTDFNVNNGIQLINARDPLVSAGVASARNSRLIETLTGDDLRPAGNYFVDDYHTQLLTPGELRLIIEWIDNGTQNYNDLFKALSKP